VSDDFEQKYDAALSAPVQVWLYCRLCRCRIQVRTVPRPTLPFRCFCGNSATFSKFDVFAKEEEVVRFAKTFEELYQTTKSFMQEAEMPMPKTRMYQTGELEKYITEARNERVDQSMDESESEAEAPETPAHYKEQVRELTGKVQKAQDVLERHEALSALGRFLFPRRDRFQDARRFCYQACDADVALARDVLREAAARRQRGEPIQLRFSLFKRLIALNTEDKNLERALEVAQRAVALGIPGYDDKVAKLKAQLGET
jgi:hypothetical protein